MNEDTEYIEFKIKELLNEMESIHWIFFNLSNKETNEFDEKQDELKENFSVLLKKTYKLIFYYLEAKQADKYLDFFIENLTGKFESGSDLLECKKDPLEKTNSEIVSELWDFLCPFKGFSNHAEIVMKKRAGLTYLHNVLSNTGSIINNLNVSPKSEAEVYNSVKVVLHAIFPKSKSAGSNFLKIAKEYKPDILIPELNLAIEYKYANTETKLKSTIEQIAADVKGYSGDNDYKLFYVVFYVTKDFWGEKKFKEVWYEQNFPVNWESFYIIG
jgi:hypothetical protein